MVVAVVVQEPQVQLVKVLMVVTVVMARPLQLVDPLPSMLAVVLAEEQVVLLRLQHSIQAGQVVVVTVPMIKVQVTREPLALAAVAAVLANLTTPLAQAAQAS